MKNVASRNSTSQISRILITIKLLLVLLVGVGAGTTAYVLGNAFTANSGTSSTGASQQTTTTTTTSASTTAHNCTLTST